VRVLFTDTLGTIIFNSANNRGVGVIALFIDEKTKNNLFEDALTTMVEGDSTQFIIKADSLYSQSFNIQLPSTVKKGENIYVFAQLYKHKRAEQIEFEKKQYERWAKEMADIERKQIEEYLEKNKLSFSLDSSGIYWLSKSPGNGKSVWQYPSVYIYLKGFLLNGVEVENTYLPNTPLEYFPGQPQQVVKAIEICLKQVRVGGKAHFIAPSALAYGAVGSSTGIIPPFTAVRYIIEVKAP
jgi:FKBP-type peptidyl-prolyl cis-trans isomerase